MFDNNMVDIKGLESSPYDLLCDCVGYTGLAAIPTGFICGVCALLFRKDPEFLSLIPTLILGLSMVGLACHQYRQYREYQWWHQFRTNPPIVVPVSPEPKENNKIDSF